MSWGDGQGCGTGDSGHLGWGISNLGISPALLSLRGGHGISSMLAAHACLWPYDTQL